MTDKTSEHPISPDTEQFISEHPEAKVVHVPRIGEHPKSDEPKKSALDDLARAEARISVLERERDRLGALVSDHCATANEHGMTLMVDESGKSIARNFQALAAESQLSTLREALKLVLKQKSWRTASDLYEHFPWEAIERALTPPTEPQHE